MQRNRTLFGLFVVILSIGLFIHFRPIQANAPADQLENALQRMAEFGLINQVVPLDQLEQASAQMARQIAGKSPAAIKIGKASSMLI